MKKDMLVLAESEEYFEEYLKPFYRLQQRDSWGYGNETNLFAHVVYKKGTLELIYYRASSNDFLGDLPELNFLDGWSKLENESNDIKRMYKTTYALPLSNAPRSLILPYFIEEILASSNGYLLYQDQMSAILRHVRQVRPSLIPMYIRNWNLKYPVTRLLAGSVFIQDVNLDDLIEDRIYDSENQFLYL